MTHSEILKEIKAMDKWAEVLADEIQNDDSDDGLVLVVALGSDRDIHARAIGSPSALHAVWESFGQQIGAQEPKGRIS